MGKTGNKRSDHHGTSARRHENGRRHKHVAKNGKPGVFIATGYDRYINRQVGGGDRFTLLTATSPVSDPSTLTPVMSVRGVTHWPIGTINAVFDNDRNYIETDDQCTAGIYLGQDEDGLPFFVQYFGHAIVRYMMWGAPNALSLLAVIFMWLLSNKALTPPHLEAEIKNQRLPILSRHDGS